MQKSIKKRTVTVIECGETGQSNAYVHVQVQCMHKSDWMFNNLDGAKLNVVRTMDQISWSKSSSPAFSILQVEHGPAALLGIKGNSHWSIFKSSRWNIFT